MRKNRLIALIGTLTMAAAGLAAVSAGVSSKKADSVSAGDTVRIYAKMEHSWWTTSSAAIGVYAWNSAGNNGWPGKRMTPVSGQDYTWYFDLDKSYTSIILTRINGSGTEADWGAQTDDLAISGDNNFYTITQSTAAWSGDGKKCSGAWSYTGNTNFYLAGSQWHWSDVSKMEEFDGDSSGEMVLNNLIVDADGTTFKGYKYKDATDYGIYYSPNQEFKDGNPISGPREGAKDSFHDPDYYISFDGQANGIINKAGTYNVYFTPSTGKFWLSVQKYDVTFDVNGATSGSNSTVTGFIAQDFTTRSSDGIEKDGYAFSGWNTKNDGTGTNYAADAVVDLGLSAGGSKTLYAKWVKVEDPTYTVAYHSNEGSDLTASQSVVVGQNFVTKAANTFTKPSGKKFKEWNTSSDGKGTSIAAGATTSSSTAKDGTYNLYAIWELNNPADGKHIAVYGAAHRESELMTWNETDNQWEGSITLAAGEEFKVANFTDENPDAWYANIISNDESAKTEAHGNQISGGGVGDSSPNLVCNVAGTYKVYMKNDTNFSIYIPYIHYDVTYTAGEGSGDDITDKVAVSMDNIVRTNSFTAPDNTKIFDNWLGSDGETYEPSDTFQLGQGGTITLTAQWRDKTIADGFYIEGTIGGEFVRIPGVLDTTNNQYIFADIELGEDDHFKVCEYKDEKVAPEDWSGYGQVDKDAPDSAATKGQIVQGNDDDIKVAEGCGGVYTIYYHHTGYTTNKVYIPCLYVVTWKNYDNTVLATENYAYTATASYKGETPTKPADASYTYSFTGWNPTPGSVLTDTTYTAQFSNTPVNYRITYVTDGTLKSSVPDSYNCDSAVTLPVESDFETKPANSRFVGWYDNNSYTGSAITTISIGTTGNKTFYGKWESEVTVTYVDDSGSRDVKGYAGETLTAPTITSRGGYSAAWSSDLATFPSVSTTINAVYSKKTYTISFSNGDGGSGGSVSPNTYQISDNAQTVTITAPTRKGHNPSYSVVTGEGYYGDAPTVDGNEVTIPAGSYGNFSINTSWTKNTYTVTLNPGDGEGGSVSPTTFQVSNVAQTITITDPVKDGYAPSYSVSGVDGATVSNNVVTIPANAVGNLVITTSWTITPEEEAKQFAEEFVKTINETEGLCKIVDYDDKDNPIYDVNMTQLQTFWENHSDAFKLLSEPAQGYLKDASPDQSEEASALGKFAWSYQYVYTKYGKNFADCGGDFLKKGYTPNSSRLVSVSDVSTSTWIIAAVAVVGIAAAGVFFIYKKRKEI